MFRVFYDNVVITKAGHRPSHGGATLPFVVVGRQGRKLVAHEADTPRTTPVYRRNRFGMILVTWTERTGIDSGGRVGVVLFGNKFFRSVGPFVSNDHPVPGDPACIAIRT